MQKKKFIFMSNRILFFLTCKIFLIFHSQIPHWSVLQRDENYIFSHPPLLTLKYYCVCIIFYIQTKFCYNFLRLNFKKEWKKAFFYNSLLFTCQKRFVFCEKVFKIIWICSFYSFLIFICTFVCTFLSGHEKFSIFSMKLSTFPSSESFHYFFWRIFCFVNCVKKIN